MLLKLFKNDIKMYGIRFITIYAVCILLSLLLRFENTLSSVGTIGIIAYFLYMIVIAVISCYTIVVMIQCYANSMFKRVGYLTLTLPVSTDCLIISKILLSLFWTIISVLVVSASVLIVDSDAADLLKQIMSAFKMINFDTTMLYMIPMLLANFLQFVMIAYLAITIVNTCYVKRFRTLLALFIYFVLTYAINFIKSILIPSLNVSLVYTAETLRELRIATNTMNEYLHSYILLIVGISLIIIVLCYLGIRYLIKNKIELD